MSEPTDSEIARRSPYRVKPTDSEIAEWKSRRPGAPPYRVQCGCGKRYWLSGLGVGSHNRSESHKKWRDSK